MIFILRQWMYNIVSMVIAYSKLITKQKLLFLFAPRLPLNYEVVERRWNFCYCLLKYVQIFLAI